MKNYNVEQLYEEYCDENELHFSNDNILGYNPVVSDVEEEAGSRHANSFTKSRWSKLVLLPKCYFYLYDINLLLKSKALLHKTLKISQWMR